MNYLTRIISATFALLSFVIFSSCNDSNDDFSEVAQTKGLIIRALANGDSRTSFDGNEKITSWTENDNLKICITGGGLDVTKDFTITNPSTGEFYNKDVTLTTNQKYNFYAIYGASEVNSNIATIQIGSEEQVQEGASTAHIAALDPLYGRCENVAPDAVSIPMSHTAVVFKLNIKNATGSSLNISRVEVAAPNDVVLSGVHTIDMKTGAITQSGLKSNQIELSLNGYSSVASGETVTAWIATAPFAIGQEDQLVFSIYAAPADNDNVGYRYDIVKSFPGGKQFQAGKIMETTMSLAENAYSSTIAKFDFKVSGVLHSTNKNLLTCVTESFMLEISSLSGCSYDVSNGCLKFNKFDSPNYASIKLPRIAGYKITRIVLDNAVDSYNSKVCLSYMNNETLKEYDVKKMLTQAGQKEFTSENLKSVITDDSQYYLKFTANNKNIYINSLEITYTRMGS